MAQAEKNARGSLLNPLPLTITNNKYEEKILTEIYFFHKILHKEYRWTHFAKGNDHF